MHSNFTSLSQNDNVITFSMVYRLYRPNYAGLRPRVILYGAETRSPTIDNYRETSTHLIIGVCVAYYEYPGGTAFQMKRSQTY